MTEALMLEGARFFNSLPIQIGFAVIYIAIGLRLAPRFHFEFSNRHDRPPFLEHFPEFEPDDPDEDDPEKRDPPTEPEDPFDDPVLKAHRKIYNEPFSLN